VLVIHRQPILRQALAALLQSARDITVVGQAASCAECCRKLGALRPDVLVCDLPASLSCRSTQVEQLREVNPSTPVVIVAGHETPAQVLSLAGLGFRGLLTPDASPDTLFDAVRAVGDGGYFLDGTAQSILVGAVNGTPRRGERTGPRLSARERRTLELIGQGRTNAEIAATLHVSTGTVKQCVSTLLRKLGAANRTAAVQVATARGLLAA
jgi:DNA-binding NarL/FixJ family response regulator